MNFAHPRRLSAGDKIKSHKLQNMNEYFDQMIYDNQKILSILESVHDNIIKEGDSSLNPS